jgi:hypothetical protein
MENQKNEGKPSDKFRGMFSENAFSPTERATLSTFDKVVGLEEKLDNPGIKYTDISIRGLANGHATVSATVRDPNPEYAFSKTVELYDRLFKMYPPFAEKIDEEIDKKIVKKLRTGINKELMESLFRSGAKSYANDLDAPINQEADDPK